MPTTPTAWPSATMPTSRSAAAEAALNVPLEKMQVRRLRRDLRHGAPPVGPERVAGEVPAGVGARALAGAGPVADPAHVVRFDQVADDVLARVVEVGVDLVGGQVPRLESEAHPDVAAHRADEHRLPRDAEWRVPEP